MYPEMSMMLSPLGIPVGDRASRTEEKIKYAELSLSDARRLHWAEFAGQGWIGEPMFTMFYAAPKELRNRFNC